MPKKPAQEQPAETTAALADPRSDRLVLAFVSSPAARRLSGVPARDLTAADIARLAYRSAARDGLADGERPDKRNPDQEAAAAIVARLLASGQYRDDVDAVLAEREAEAAAPEAEKAESSDSDAPVDPAPDPAPAPSGTQEG